MEKYLPIVDLGVLAVAVAAGFTGNAALAIAGVALYLTNDPLTKLGKR